MCSQLSCTLTNKNQRIKSDVHIFSFLFIPFKIYIIIFFLSLFSCNQLIVPCTFLKRKHRILLLMCFRYAWLSRKYSLFFVFAFINHCFTKVICNTAVFPSWHAVMTIYFSVCLSMYPLCYWELVEAMQIFKKLCFSENINAGSSEKRWERKPQDYI